MEFEFGTNGNLIAKDARIIFRNFAGKESQFNPAGTRNFCLVLSDQAADELTKKSWNVKKTRVRSPDDDPIYYISVAVKFGAYPPNVWLVSGKSKTQVTEDIVSTLDSVELERVDVEIRPYTWSAAGKTGVKAYLKTMYATIREDPFATQYRFDDEPKSNDEEALPF